jgi:hypothetical protein
VNSQNLANWVQILTGFALIVGLGLVIWELQQTRDVVFAQLTSDGYSDVTQQQTAVMGESAADAIAKACDAPESLTTKDLVVLDAYFGELVNRMRRNISIAERAGFYSDETQYRENWTGNLKGLFDTIPGRVWWEASNFGQPLQQYGDRVLNELGPPDCSKYFVGFKDEIQKATRTPNDV